MIWATIRYPALIPQVWLNWLYAAPDDLVKTLDRRPSRVDFVAFANGKRHVIEIDGLSHYAAFDEVTRSYSPDEREYARNLRIERWLRFDGWEVTRIGRHEVSEVIRNENDDFLPAYGLLRVLPFGSDYPMQPSATGLGLGSIDYAVRVPAGNLDWDDIPVLEDDPPF